jgi:UDP-2-acetamido-2,6-beta-L-arabino-hexul-4-ose reductase
VTGAGGFLGWHLRCALLARGIEATPVDSTALRDPQRLDRVLAGADAVFHLAGLNRASAADLSAGNPACATALTSSLRRLDLSPTVIYANSTQAGNGTAYGDGKHAAAMELLHWGKQSGAAVVDVRLPNLFGEHGRPHYNSVVATFCHELATGGSPSILEDRELSLLHAQDAVDVLVAGLEARRSHTVTPSGTEVTVGSLLTLLRSLSEGYAEGQIPALSGGFERDLFNTYRSFCFPALFPIHPKVHADARGDFFECTRAAGGPSQVSCSTTVAGVTRGDHFHRRKVERFQVLRGTAVIELRRLFQREVVSFRVSGDRPAVVDMPTMWSHSITNTGEAELVTLFWAADLFDPDDPDTYSDPVRQRDGAGPPRSLPEGAA